MIVSPFTPLNFHRWRTDGNDCRYMQTFAPTDHILIECFGSPQLYIKHADGTTIQIGVSQWQMNEETTLAFAVISGLSNGVYSVLIEESGERVESAPFCITDDPIALADTTLIQYANRDNRQRTDVVFDIDGMRYFFDLRIPGGFRDNGWSFSLDGEQFTDQSADITQLYARESTQQKLTVGTSEGCQIWFGEMLNRALCCEFVYADRVRYARKEASVPEITQPLEGLNSFIFTQSLQRVVNLDPKFEAQNRAILRRVADDYRLVATDINRIIR